MSDPDNFLKQITFTGMQLKHLEQVLAIENYSFPTPWTPNAFEYELVKNDFAHYVVALDKDGQVIGYAGMWVLFDEAHVTSVATRREFRGRGLGTALMLEIMGQALLRGANKMTLEVRPSNQVARRLYQGLGFVEKGIRKQYYADTKEDAIIMWKYDLAGL